MAISAPSLPAPLLLWDISVASAGRSPVCVGLPVAEDDVAVAVAAASVVAAAAAGIVGGGRQPGALKN